MAVHALDNNLWFPAVEEADPCGLLAVGGDLSPSRLLMAYCLGIFPWFNPEDPILWWSPDPRCLLFPDKLHISRSLKRFMRKEPYRITFNEDMAGVIRCCRELRADDDGNGTWITEEMSDAYLKLHQLGFVHSVECYEGDDLVGGLYGVSIGRFFFGESMFSLRVNASKVVLVQLIDYLRQRDFVALDCQQTTDHLLSMGACDVSREEFLALLRQADVPPEGPLVSCFVD